MAVDQDPRALAAAEMMRLGAGNTPVHPASAEEKRAGKVCANCANWQPTGPEAGYCAVWETDTIADDSSEAFAPIGG